MTLRASLIVDIVVVYIQKSHFNKGIKQIQNDYSVIAIVDTINILWNC